MAGDLIFSGAFRNIWPLFLPPAVTALVGDWTARRLPRTPASWIPAAILAAAPGLVALGAICPAVTTWDQIHTWRGVVLFRVTPAVALGLLGYAAARAVLRQREVGRLFRAAAAPGPRLAAAARALGLPALELPTAELECFVAGVRQPTVFVSRGALAQLGDAELQAALCHERAHLVGRDTAMLFALCFLRDLAPWGRGAALGAFQAAREAAADREAAARAGPLSLASALVALARPGLTPVAVLPMAKPDTLRWRMQALLEPQAKAPVSRRSLAAVAGGLGLSVAMLAWPLAQFELWLRFC
jgi:Zn-dependent protease with chaperone function